MLLIDIDCIVVLFTCHAPHFFVPCPAFRFFCLMNTDHMFRFLVVFVARIMHFNMLFQYCNSCCEKLRVVACCMRWNIYWVRMVRIESKCLCAFVFLCVIVCLRLLHCACMPDLFSSVTRLCFVHGMLLIDCILAFICHTPFFCACP